MLTNHPGLELMQAEMSVQRQDAMSTFARVQPVARRVAERIRATGRLVLYGIGGSHYVNRIAETLYLQAGIDARAAVASEVLLSPLPTSSRVALMTSQSGRSGEIIALLSRTAGAEERFAITLEPDSPLARQTVASLVAAGGSERAFAATRSIVLSVTMHAAILEALGHTQEALRKVLESDSSPDAGAASALLSKSDLVIMVGRHVMRGTAESAALSLMELARMPTLALEGGQFRHGPFEFLRPGLSVVLLRSAGSDQDGIAELAGAALDSGCSTLILDSSGLPAVAGGLTVSLPPAEGIAAAVQTLLFMQRVNINVAQQRISHGAGTPLRTSKVTV